jgi:hypothetical protein
MNQALFHLHQLPVPAPVASPAPFHLHQLPIPAPVASQAPFRLRQLLSRRQWHRRGGSGAPALAAVYIQVQQARLHPPEPVVDAVP